MDGRGRDASIRPRRLPPLPRAPLQEDHRKRTRLFGPHRKAERDHLHPRRAHPPDGGRKNRPQKSGEKYLLHRRQCVHGHFRGKLVQQVKNNLFCEWNSSNEMHGKEFTNRFKK